MSIHPIDDEGKDLAGQGDNVAVEEMLRIG